MYKDLLTFREGFLVGVEMQESNVVDKRLLAVVFVSDYLLYIVKIVHVCETVGANTNPQRGRSETND